MKYRIAIGIVVICIILLALLYFTFRSTNTALGWASKRDLVETHIESVEPTIDYHQLQLKADAVTAENTYPWLWFQIPGDGNLEIYDDNGKIIEFIPKDGVINYKLENSEYILNEIKDDPSLVHPAKSVFKPSARYGGESLDFPNMTINFIAGENTDVSFPRDFSKLERYIGFDGEKWEIIPDGFKKLESGEIRDMYQKVVWISEGKRGLGYLNFSDLDSVFFWGQDYRRLQFDFSYGGQMHKLSMAQIYNPGKWLAYKRNLVYEPCYYEKVSLWEVNGELELLPCEKYTF